MRVAHVPHRVTASHRAALPLVIGGRDGGTNHMWDGLVDEVRLTAAALAEGQLLFHKPAALKETVGWWRFEDEGGFAKDHSGRSNDIRGAAALSGGDPRQAARIDLCHVLLNSNEFLYVE
jgi:hypothetical protein